MTLTENRDLGTPWQFTIGQMSKGQGPGFISLDLSCAHLPEPEPSRTFSQTYDQPPLPGPAVMASVPRTSDAALPPRYGGV